MRKNSEKLLSLVLALVMVLGMLPTAARAAETPEEVGPVWAKMVSAGNGHSLAVKTNGTLWAWGSNSFGQLGDGTTMDRLKPVKIMDDVVSVSAGGYSSFAIKKDGSLWAWGENEFFTLGDGSTTDRHSPVKIMENAKTVVGGSERSYVIKADHSLWGWGSNFDNSFNKNPEKIMDDVAMVSPGHMHTLAVKTDGSLWSWGYNYQGELGDNSPKNHKRTVPAKVMDGVAGVAAGSGYSLIVKTDSSLWSCGNNSWGCLGDGTTKSRFSPVKIMDDVAAVSAGSKPFAIKTDGSLWAWGKGNGIGGVTSKDYRIPMKILEDVETVTNMGSHTLAVTTDHNLWAWGNGYNGELGDGTGETHNSPVKIMNLLGVDDTIVEETLLRAKLLATDHSFAFYREWESPIQIMAKQLDPYASAAWYTVENLLETYYKSLITLTDPGDTATIEFYEYLLVNLLDSNAQEYLAVSEPFGMLKNYSGVDLNSVLMEKLVSAGFEAGTKITDENKSLLKDVCVAICGLEDSTDVGWLDTLLVSGKSLDAFAAEAIKIYALTSVSDARAETVKMIGEHTQDENLKKATNNVYSSIREAKKDCISYCLLAGTASGLSEINLWLMDKIVDKLCSLHPASQIWKASVEAATLSMDAIFQIDDIATDTIRILAMANVEKALLNAIDKTEDAFLSSNELEDAQQLLALADTLKQELLAGCDLVLALIDHTERGDLNWHGILDLLSMVQKNKADFDAILKWVFGDPDSEYAQLRKSVTNIRKTVQNANFYAGSVSVLELLRENQSKTPSTWAEGEVSKAINYGFLPSVMQNNYQANITRIEFCALLEYMIESKTGKTALELADELAEEQGGYIKPPFDDALYMEVNDIARLGIITGVGNNMFSPLGEITRQEAATMLYRTANVLGYDASAGQTGYSGVASWASEGVDFVSDRGIMNGTANGFDPVGKYTKEQAILTMVRFYENVK